MRMGRGILKQITVFVGLCCLLGVTIPASADLNFGLTPYLAQNRLRLSFEPLLAALAKQLKQPVHLVILDNYPQLTQQMAAGKVDLGVFSPAAYVDAAEKASVKLLLSQLVKGEQPHKAMIFLRKTCDIKTIGQMRGKEVAFVDPQSAYAYLYPRFQFNSDEAPADLYFNRILFGGSRRRVFDAVLEGTIDGGIIFYEGSDEMGDAMGVPVHELTTYIENEPVQYHAYACRQALPEKVIQEVQAFFLALKPTDPPLKTILAQPGALQFERWMFADDSFVDLVRSKLAVAKQKLKIAILPFHSADPEFYYQHGACMAWRLFYKQLDLSQRFDVRDGFNIRPDSQQAVNQRSVLPVDLIISAELIREDHQLTLNVQGTEGYKGRVVLQDQTPCQGLADLDETVTRLATHIQEEIPLLANVERVDHKLIAVNGGLEEGFRPGAAFMVLNMRLDEKRTGKKKAMGGPHYRIVAEGRLEKVNPHDALGRIASGDMALINIGDRIKTITSGYHGSTQPLESYDAYLEGGRQLARGGHQQAIAAFAKSLEYDAAYAMAQAKLSTGYYNLRQTQLGSSALERAKSQMARTRIPERNYILARAATEKGDYRAAVRSYNDTLNRYPYDTAALHNLGVIYLDGRYDGHSCDLAIIYLQKALASNPALEVTKSALRRAWRLKTTMNDTDVDVHPTAMVDLVVVLDTSGSMAGNLPTIVDRIAACIDRLASAGTDLHLGLVTFGSTVRQIFCRQPDHSPPLVNNTLQFKAWLRSLRAYGGGDEDVLGALAAAMHYNLRSEAKKLLVVVTDEAAHLQTDHVRQTIGQTLEGVSAKAATVFMVAPNDGRFQTIARRTGGDLFDIKANRFVTAIVEYAAQNVSGWL